MANEHIIDERLMCSVVSLNYDFPCHIGYLYLRANDCCDMSGCVDLFTAIDPKVRTIHTYSGNEADTDYVEDDGEWKAFCHA